MGDISTEDHTTIEQTLKGEAFTKRERLAPRSTHIGNTDPIVELRKIVGDIGIASHKSTSTGGEVPVILGVELHLGLIDEIMTVFEIDLSR